jgi:hypothetical protein
VAGERPLTVTTTAILAVIGGITVILTAAARVPAALAEFLRACIVVAAAARELRTALTKRVPGNDPARVGNPDQPHVRRTSDISAEDFGR